MSGASRGTAWLLKLGRFELWGRLVLLYLLISTSTRLVLFGVARVHGQAGLTDLAPVLGIGLGLARVAQGAHFLSHIIWSALVCWLVSLALYEVILRRRCG